MLTIDSARLLRDLRQLAKVGATPDGGVSRMAFSDEDLEGRNWFQRKVTEAGLEYHIDGAGNQSAIFHSDPPSRKRLLIGSHLDSVPNGGRYDGALGTLAAFEALRTLKDEDYRPPITLEAINFSSEENVVAALMGSRAAAGLLTAEDFSTAALSEAALRERLNSIGISKDTMLDSARDDVAAWVELHIEQGSRLEDAGTDIGVVNAIVGVRNAQVTFTGEAAHAGTQPLEKRRDALWGSSHFILRARYLVMRQFTPGVVNIGTISVDRGAMNIVPGRVDLTLEFRHGTSDQLDQMQSELRTLIDETAAEFGLEATYRPKPHIPPATLDERVMAAIESACDTCQLTHQRMLSFAGHDTQSMAHIAPSGMFFVPSATGISHHHQEFTTDQDCINGGNVILQSILALVDAFG